MGQIDLAMKEALKQGEYFADICNMLLFQGRQVVLPEKLTPMDTAEELSIRSRKQSFSIERQRDVLKLVNVNQMEDERAAYVIIGIENQSEIHYAMPIRNMLYDALQYSIQVQESGEKRGGSAAEFLSGMTADDRIKPVITMVVYTGEEPWEYPLSIRDVVDTSGLPTEMLQYIPDTRLLLLDVRHSQDLDLLRTGLKHIFKAIQFYKRKRELKEYILNPDNGFAHVPTLLANVFEQLVKLKLPDLGAEEEVNMCEALEELMQDCRAEGRKEGREEGIGQGRQSELQEVCSTLFQIGTDEATIATLLHMRGLDTEQAAELMERCRQSGTVQPSCGL